ncbi:MAG: cytochrome P450 [Immundisolibacter sp.]|uniref:cytochrome P450 n=1 Tax=Immundisolibacter sp. TaxID=1934948 RepID=UPI003D14C6C4
MLDTVKTLRMIEQDPSRIPLDQIDVSQGELYEHDAQWGFFERLRRDDPIHYCADSEYGPFWSVTKFNDIAHVEKNHQLFSSEPTITIADLPEEIPFQSFIQMDPPKHDVQRAAVQPVVAPMNLAKLESVIRERAGRILDDLPVGETFDWVEHVSINLTTQMLATLFDFPFEERRKLTYWSDAATASDLTGDDRFTPEERNRALAECGEYFVRLWHERVNGTPGNDLISMLAHSERTRNIIDSPMEYLGNIILLIIGGNDTTRNSITGGVLALNQNPAEYDKLRRDTSLIPNMVSEIIRWQTPILSMRRRAKEDTDLLGKHVRKGDKVVMWYVSGNRDDEVIDDPMSFKIDRENARHHLSFGFGIHRCMGNRLAEMQLRVSWEEIMKRFRMVEVVGEAVRAKSNIIRGYRSMPVQVHPW